MSPKTKNMILVIVLVSIGGTIWYLEASKPITAPAQDIVLGNDNTVVGNASSTEPAASTPKVTTDRTEIRAEKAKQYPRAKEFSDPTGFINTPTFKLADLVGKKVILIDFWTYSCINCQRTIPYLNTWYSKYESQGLVIIGVHTPEFGFEKVYDNVAKAVAAAGIKYPVVMDSNMGTWNAYQNLYWPREYLIDIDGFIVHDHIGEGDYDVTEKAIQAALRERAEALGISPAGISTTISVPKSDDIEGYSPETYFGSARNQYLANGYPGQSGQQTFTAPSTVNPSKLYLTGPWNIAAEYAETSGASKIDYRYQAMKMFFVAGSSGAPIDVEVQENGKPIDPSKKGADIFYKDGKSYVEISADRLYKIIEGTKADEQNVQFIIPSAGLQAYTFTFG